MTEEELIAAAKQIAEKMKSAGFESVEYIDEGKLEGEPASIVVELEGGQMFALGVLPV